MSDINLIELTVIELRKLAKKLKVPLQAGISKQGIIEKLSAAIADAEETYDDPDAGQTVDDSDAAEDAPEAAEEEPDEEEQEDKPDLPPAQPQFRQAYVASSRFNNKPAYQVPSFMRPGSQRSAMPADNQRPQNPRPAGFQSRFGPAAAQPVQQDGYREEERSRHDRPAYAQPRSSYNDSSRFNPPPFERSSYEPPRPASNDRPAYEPPRFGYAERSGYEPPRPSSYERPAYDPPRPGSFERPSYEAPRAAYNEPRPNADPRPASTLETAPFTVNPTIEELVQTAECPRVSGILELLPEGFGFLRSEGMLASARDVYVAPAQIRRFALRTGDLVKGTSRPQREGDKYPALLEVEQINGVEAGKGLSRPNYDALTPIYPTRRIQLERKDAPQLSDLRLMDLITPIGFGQRGLIQCGPGTGKTRLLTRLANAITLNHPEAEVMLLLFNETPENVTVIRESVKCSVIASTFDMPPENHLRIADLTIERAQRLVEMKKDVVILADSLTTLVRVISTAAMQAGRVIPGMINPQSLQKAKRLFGAARCIREGGSLTVIATMNTDSGAKADDSMVNEFRGAANMELVLDSTLARAGLYPPFELTRCGTKRAEAILSPAQAECIKLLRGMLGRLPTETALKELTSMLEKTSTNAELVSRVKVWAESMKG